MHSSESAKMYHSPMTIERGSWIDPNRSSKWFFVKAGAATISGSACGATGQFLISSGSRQKNYWELTFGVLIIIVGALIGFLATYLIERQNKARQREQGHQLVQFSDKLGDVVRPLLVFLGSKRTKEDSNIILQEVLTAGSNLFSYNGVRLCLYQLDAREEDSSKTDSRSDNQLSGQDKCAIESRYLLQLLTFGGRNDAPRKSFSPECKEGTFAIRNVLDNVSMPVSDLMKFEGDVVKKPGAAWKSFCTFPISDRIGTKKLGLLTVDSRQKVNWTVADQSIGGVICLILAIGMAELELDARDEKPEFDSIRRKLKALAAKESSVDTKTEAEDEV